MPKGKETGNLSTPSEEGNINANIERSEGENPPNQQEEPLECPRLSIYGPYKYLIPKPDGDPWDILLEPKLKEDKDRCGTWKEEVENLLIFAGLFSAVVTAFIVESYKNLKLDPNDAAVALLSRIAERLDNPINAMTSIDVVPAAPVPFSPSSSSIRVNILLFLSLILSLTSVLIGTIALQWLREHQRYTDKLDSRERYGAFYMCSDGLDAWYIPQIFTTLPLLLQIGLVFFFIGIIDFLVDLHPTVAIPVTILIGFVLLFIIITTTLPTLQALSLFFPRWRATNKPRSQCPYKSPQSWAFHKLSIFVWKITRSLLSKCQRCAVIFLQVKNKPHNNSFYMSPRMPKPMFQSHQHDWQIFDKWWLIQRDIDFMALHRMNAKKESDIAGPLYDSTHGLCETVKDMNMSRTDQFKFSVYYGFSQLAGAHVWDPEWLGAQISEQCTFNDCFNNLMHNEPLDSDSHLSCLIRHPQNRRTNASNMLYVMHTLQSEPNSNWGSAFEEHYWELCMHSVIHQYLRLSWGSKDDSPCHPHFLDAYTNDLFSRMTQSGHQEPLWIMHSFFERVATTPPRKEIFKTENFHAGKHIFSFLTSMARIAVLCIEVNNNSRITVMTLDLISEQLASYLYFIQQDQWPNVKNAEKRPDYLFYTSIIYSGSFRLLRHWHHSDYPLVSAALANLRGILKSYAEHLPSPHSSLEELDQCVDNLQSIKFQEIALSWFQLADKGDSVKRSTNDHALGSFTSHVHYQSASGPSRMKSITPAEPPSARPSNMNHGCSEAPILGTVETANSGENTASAAEIESVQAGLGLHISQSVSHSEHELDSIDPTEQQRQSDEVLSSSSICLPPDSSMKAPNPMPDDQDKDNSVGMNPEAENMA